MWIEKKIPNLIQATEWLSCRERRDRRREDPTPGRASWLLRDKAAIGGGPTSEIGLIIKRLSAVWSSWHHPNASIYVLLETKVSSCMVCVFSNISRNISLAEYAHSPSENLPITEPVALLYQKDLY